jgi:NADPH:quinone reductase-like Zn-dependent oxidoreductase
MQAAGIRVKGGTVGVLELPEPPEPDGDELLLDVQAAGLANWDEFARTGAWDLGIEPPMALGVEAAGIVRAVGPAVKRFRAGDGVIVHSAPLRYQGAWAPLFLAAEADVAAKPAFLDWTLGAVLPVPLLTAAQVVSGLGCQPPGVVLIHGAGGLTGGLLVVMAAQAGWHVIATASPASADRVRGYGAAELVDHRLAGWRTMVRASYPGGVMAGVNAVPGGAASLLPLVAPGGCLTTITGDPPLSERGIAVTNAYVAPDGPGLEVGAALVARMRLDIPIAGIHPLAEAAAVLRLVAEGSGGTRVVDPRR